MRAFLKAIGFIVGVATGLLAELLLLYLVDEVTGRSFYPRGLGWLAIPVAAGFLGATLAPVLPVILVRAAPQLLEGIGASRHRRLMLVGVVTWVVGFTLYWVLAKPYGYRMYDDDWLHFVELLLIPPLFYIACYLAFLWATRTEDAQRPPRRENS